MEYGQPGHNGVVRIFTQMLTNLEKVATYVMYNRLEPTPFREFGGSLVEIVLKFYGQHLGTHFPRQISFSSETAFANYVGWVNAPCRTSEARANVNDFTV